jgi:hypothetical protein
MGYGDFEAVYGITPRYNANCLVRYCSLLHCAIASIIEVQRFYFMEKYVSTGNLRMDRYYIRTTKQIPISEFWRFLCVCVL